MLVFLMACGGSTDPSAAEECDLDLPGPRRLRRLTHAEYADTVAALTDTTPDEDFDADFAEDEVVHGFDNNAEALTVSALLADQYMRAAEAVAESADLSALLPCNPDTVDWSECAAQAIAAVGLRAFRRPLLGDEIAAYHALWVTVATDDGFDEGVRWVLTAMLQSPHFLYRSELGVGDGDGSFQLSDHEIAAQMAFLLWGQGPTPALLSRAARGGLHRADERLALAEEMLADSRAAEVFPRFVSQWLGLSQLQYVTREDDLTDALREEMQDETDRLVADVAASGGGLSALLLAQHTFVTADLAAHYGIEVPDAVDADGFGRAELAEGGLLAQGSLLTTHALPEGSSPIHRGALVRERLLCEELPAPPPDLDITPPEADASLTTRERYAQHAVDPACAGCHDRIDPVGFGFEHYDGVGRWRSHDGGHPVDGSGEIRHSLDADGEFYGVTGLSERLSDSSQAQSCFVQMFLTHTMATDDEEQIGCLTGHIGPDGAASMSELLLAVVASDAFVWRHGGAGEGDVSQGDGDELPSDLLDTLPEVEPDPLEVVVEQDSWGSSYCSYVSVTNVSAESVQWSLTLAVEGTLSSVWSAEYSASEGDVTFTGVSWNAALDPGEDTSFGFCGSAG